MKKGILAKMNAISKGKLSKLVLLAVSVFLLFNFISCGKESPTEPESPKITQIEGKVVGLFDKQPINLTRVKLLDDYDNEVDTCSIDGNTFRDDNVENPQLVTRIRIESDEAYNRITNLPRLTIGANNVFGFDMVESYKPLDEYRIVGRDPSPRWETPPKFYIYDKSLWHGLEITDTTLESSQINLNLARIIDVINNDIPKLTNYFVSDPTIQKESLGHEHPGLEAEDYVIIRFRDDMPLNDRIYTGFDDPDWEIHNGLVSINYLCQDIIRGGFSQDICETMGFIDTLKKCDYSIFGPDDCLPSEPTPFDIDAGKFKYSRPHKNRTQGNIPDYDPISSQTSGLLLHKVEPIYELNPLNRFNQFQQPTFRPHPKSNIEKRAIKAKGK